MIVGVLAAVVALSCSAFSEETVLPGPQIYPVSMVSPWLFNAQKGKGESAKNYRYAVYDIADLVEAGRGHFMISGESATNEKAYPLAIFLDKAGNVLKKQPE